MRLKGRRDLTGIRVYPCTADINCHVTDSDSEKLFRVHSYSPHTLLSDGMEICCLGMGEHARNQGGLASAEGGRASSNLFACHVDGSDRSNATLRGPRLSPVSTQRRKGIGTSAKLNFSTIKHHSVWTVFTQCLSTCLFEYIRYALQVA